MGVAVAGVAVIHESRGKEMLNDKVISFEGYGVTPREYSR